MNNYYITPEHFATAKANGIPARTVSHRVYHLRWTIERATTQPM